MVFERIDGDETKEKTYQRTLTEFRVDDQKVTFAEYHKELEKINIFIKVKYLILILIFGV